MNDVAKPASPGYKIAIDVVRQVLSLGREQGLPVDELVAQWNIDIEPLQGDPSFVAGPEVERILAVGMRLLPDPLPGLHALSGQIGSLFGLAGFLIQTASTLGAVFHNVSQAEKLIGNTGITRIRHEPGEAHLLWDCRFTDPYVRWHVADFILGVYGWLIQSAARPGLEMIRAVHFSHGAPDDTALVQRYVEVFGCPVYFNQTAHRLVLPSAVLDLPLPSANPQLHDVLKMHAQKVMEERSQNTSLVDLARSCLHELMHRGDASRENLAAALNMSGRTLHRRLRESDTSYRELFDDLRLERAKLLLQDDALSVHQVAEHAGFDEHNSFTRWFRQLTGMAPSEYRQRMHSGEH